MNRTTLLYIEDDRAQREELARALESRDYAVICAASGAEGLEIASGGGVDLVLCDLNMPEMDGIEVLRAMRARGVRLPVLILTSRGSVDLAVESIREGADNFISKPPDLDQIDASVRNALERSRMERKLESDSEDLEAAVRERTEELEKAYARLAELNRDMKQEVRRRTAELEEHAIALARANVDLLGARELLESKNEELKEAEERMKSIIDASPVPLVVTRLVDGTIVYANRHLLALVGMDREEFIGRSAPDFYGDPMLRDRVLETLKRDGSVQSFEVRMKQPDGGPLWMMLSTNLTELSGEPVLVSGLYDIDKRKKAEEELERTNRELRETHSQLVQSEKMAALGVLVAGIAHEINTPIGAVSSMHDTLLRSMARLKEILLSGRDTGSFDAARVDTLLGVIQDANDVMKTGIERVRTIVGRLRSFARLDEAELKAVDINEGIEDTLALVHHELKHDIAVNRNYGDMPPLPCFPGRLNQVFLNLVVNARQAITGKGTIDIETRMDGHTFVAVFSDSGAGIPPENLEKIFDPGFTTKGVGVGTGLGLSICYGIIQDHFGEIRVDSEVGKGTTFTIRIPDNLDEFYDESGELKKKRT